LLVPLVQPAVLQVLVHIYTAMAVALDKPVVVLNGEAVVAVDILLVLVSLEATILAAKPAQAAEVQMAQLAATHMLVAVVAEQAAQVLVVLVDIQLFLPVAAAVAAAQVLAAALAAVPVVLFLLLLLQIQTVQRVILDADQAALAVLIHLLMVKTVELPVVAVAEVMPL